MTAVQYFQPGNPQQGDSDLPDLDCRDNIDAMVHGFYRRLLDDPVMAPMFLEVAAIDLQQHLPTICQYWYKMLLGESDYRRHMMAKHRSLDDKQPLTANTTSAGCSISCRIWTAASPGPTQTGRDILPFG